MFEQKHIFFILLLNFHQCLTIKFSKYTLYRSIPVNESNLMFLHSLSQLYEVNFWREPGALHKPVDFVIAPDKRKPFLRKASQNGLYFTTIMEDVQKAFDTQTVQSYIRRRTESFDWLHYFRVSDIYSWLEDLNKIYPKEMKLKSIGKTFEDRNIMAVTIFLKNAKVKSTVFFEGGIHAREWVSPAFVTYMIYQILHAPSSEDKLLKKIALSHEWHFVPVLNPDGYEFAHTTNRMWRKNRHHGNSGVDINRNFDIGFETVGISFHEKSDIYCGPRAFSERESKALRDFVKSISNNLKFYFGFHSYGQYMIIPYAHSTDHSDNYNELKSMAAIAASKIALRSQTAYTFGTAYDTVGYLTSGVSECWVKKTFDVPYVVTFELRDDGMYGFALPPNLILPTCEETMDGVISFLVQGNKQEFRQTQELLGNSQVGDQLDKSSDIVPLLIIVYFYSMVFVCS